jgi:hypothetical protein
MAPIPLTWPPSLASYKIDLKLDAPDTRYDDALQSSLNAAVAFVERTRSDVNFYEESGGPTGVVTMDLILGTLRYARRLDVRRDAPLAAIVTDSLGGATITGQDADVERLLRIGRYGRVRFA